MSIKTLNFFIDGKFQGVDGYTYAHICISYYRLFVIVIDDIKNSFLLYLNYFSIICLYLKFSFYSVRKKKLIISESLMKEMRDHY